MKRITVSIAILASGTLSVAAASYHEFLQAPSQPTTIGSIRQIRDNLYWIHGGDPTVGRRESGVTSTRSGRSRTSP
jgi:hypothetical protein